MNELRLAKQSNRVRTKLGGGNWVGGAKDVKDTWRQIVGRL